MEYFKRSLRLLFGLTLVSIGSYLNIQANIGLAPWDAFNIGVSLKTGISYGDISVWTGVLIIGADLLLGEKCGFGTVVNAVYIGKLVDLFLRIGPLPKLQSFWLGVPVLLCGQVLLSVGCYFYISAALGAGPRDSLMAALCRRMPRVPVGAVRGLIEGAVLLIGWVLGAKVGLGTVISVFGISFIMQATFMLFKFDIKTVRHENFADTWANLRHS